MKEKEKRPFVSVEASIDLLSRRCSVLKSSFFSDCGQVSHVNSVELPGNKHIPRILLLLLKWSENEDKFPVVDPIWNLLADGMRKDSIPEKLFGSIAGINNISKIIKREKGHLRVQVPFDAVEIRIFADGQSTAFEGTEAIQNLESLGEETAASEPEVTDRSFARFLASKIQLPNMNDEFSVFVGKIVWISRLSELHSIIETQILSEPDLFSKLDTFLRNRIPSEPQDLVPWMYEARGVAKRLRSNGIPTLADRSSLKVADLADELTDLAGVVDAWIQQESAVRAKVPDSRTPEEHRSDMATSLEAQKKAANAFAKNLALVKRRKAVEEIQTAIDLQIGECRARLQGILNRLQKQKRR